MKHRSLLEWALILPIIGIALLVVRAEIKVRDGRMYRVALRGYDPRDLIHGHYLSVQFNLASHGFNRSSMMDGADGFCLVRDGRDWRISSGLIADFSSQKCSSVTAMSNLLGPKRYLVPEAHALKLEKALETHETTVDLIIQENGDVSMGMLYLNGLPWRDVLKNVKASSQ